MTENTPATAEEKPTPEQVAAKARHEARWVKRGRPTWLVKPEDAGKRADGEPIIVKSNRSGDTYVQAPNGRLERGVPKVRGKAARKAAKRARQLARERAGRQ